MSWIENAETGVLLNVRVVPNASLNEVSGLLGGQLKVRIQSPANEGKANKTLVKFLSKKLGVSKPKITILKGEKSREKTILIADTDSHYVEEILLGG